MGELSRAACPMAVALIFSAKWHAANWPSPSSRNGGSWVWEHFGSPTCAYSQQRVWKRHPGGGAAGLGTSPLRTMRRLWYRGIGSGTAESNATLYGWRGSA